MPRHSSEIQHARLPEKFRCADLTGKRFGRLLVLSFAGPKGEGKKKRNHWNCLCDCGTECSKNTGTLTYGQSRSCGCLKKELHAAVHTKHGRTHSREYEAYHHMLKRCFKKNDIMYKNYGGRGITVCERWRHSFDNFFADMGECPPSLTLDRIDSDKNYEPGNCRWTTMKEQQRNRTNNHLVEFNGQTKCVAEWCELLGLKPMPVYLRLYRGWTPEKAFTTPLRFAVD